MSVEKVKVYLVLIYVLLASLIGVLIFSGITVVRTQREVDENHAFFGKNHLAHTQSLNRLVFTLNDLLSYDEEGKPEALIIVEKSELCRAVVSNARYIQELPLHALEGLFEDDPLFLQDRMIEHKSRFDTILAELNIRYQALKNADPAEELSSILADFEETGREMMNLLETQNHLMTQFDDYVFSHLQSDLETVNGILRSFIVIHAVLTAILAVVSFLYFSFTTRTNRELVYRRNHLEEMVALRTRDLEAALEEKDYLLKEVHHRVKNNLAVIESMVRLQIESAGNEELEATLLDISSRVRSIALVHQKIYQSASLSRIGFKEYVSDLAEAIVESFATQDITINISMDDIELEAETAIPLGIIISELVTNAVKYGFKDRTSGVISFGLVRENGSMVFTVHNDGHPFPENIDFKASPSLGLNLVCGLVEQIEGEISLERRNGTLFTIRFSEHD